jgi:hypothetical protein
VKDEIRDICRGSEQFQLQTMHDALIETEVIQPEEQALRQEEKGIEQ